MPDIDPRKAPTYYILLMALWVYGFAAIDRDLPAPVVFLSLLAAGAVQVGLGYAIGRWEAVAMAAVPVLLALAAGGRASGLWITVAVLMVFPGAPLIALGVYARRWHAERHDDSPDAWLYGENSD
jgi:hypothetical protein